jgi:hypothetical protein
MIINNKEAKFFWGMIAFEVYQEAIIKAAKNRSNLTTFSVGSVSAILWGGILNYYERLFIECPFNYSEVYDHVENAALSGEIDKGIEECILAFNNSVAVQNASKVSEEDVKKKKSVAKK